MAVRSLAFTLLLVAGCAGVRATQQQPAHAPSIAQAPTFYVRPLCFPMTQSWEDQATWADHVDAWTRAYEDGVSVYARGELAGRHVQLLAPGENATDGIIVEASVSAIRRSPVGALGDDHLESDVVFVDARSGQRLLTAKVDSSSERLGPEGWTFGGRVKFCSLNLAKGVVRAMREGRFPQ